MDENLAKNGITEGLDTTEYQLVLVDKQALFTRFYVTYNEEQIMGNHRNNEKFFLDF